MMIAPAIRCFGTGDRLYEAYHDLEWGRPIIDSPDESELFERIVLEGFQAGLSWATILHRRAAFREAFDGFKPDAVAAYDDARVELLMSNTAIIRNRNKIMAAVNNARTLVTLHDRGEMLRVLIDRHAPMPRLEPLSNWNDVPALSPESIALSKALKQRGFRFVGPVTVYALMQAIGIVDDHLADCLVRSVKNHGPDPSAQPQSGHGHHVYPASG